MFINAFEFNTLIKYSCYKGKCVPGTCGNRICELNEKSTCPNDCKKKGYIQAFKDWLKNVFSLNKDGTPTGNAVYDSDNSNVAITISEDGARRSYVCYEAG